MTVISNNIFDNTPSCFTLNSIFNNNIYFSSAGYTNIYINSDPNQPDSNSISGNFIGYSPQFVNVPDNNFDFSYDFSLSESSVGKNASTDGTDIGIFGGEGFSTTGEPSLPIVTTLLIKNASLEQNGLLQVEVKGRANN